MEIHNRKQHCRPVSINKQNMIFISGTREQTTATPLSQHIRYGCYLFFLLFLPLKMKRKLDHGPDGRPFPSGKKHCKGNGCIR